MSDPRADARPSGNAVPRRTPPRRRAPRWMIVVLLGAVGAGEVAAEPTPPAFTGDRPVEVVMTAGYGRTYAPRKLPATLHVAMDGKGDQRTVTLSARQGAKRHSCTLKGKLEHGALVFRAHQPCELELSTPDVCVLARERCDARVTGLRCDREHPGRLAGQLIRGRASEAGDGKWMLALEYSVDACVLAQGFNRDAPILVQGGTLTVETR